MDRLLAAEEAAPLDYTVFSVVIVTLCIVLVVEVLRHQLDVAASGNPFFQTVLELMYRELTTLGIVEFCIYLMHKYHENFNYAMEVVFVDVHFMLFYTALFNAIQSVLIRLVTTRRTDKAWVQTEEIDIGHYVAIRKEFDRVENEWKMLQNNTNESNLVNHDSARSSSLNASFHEADHEFNLSKSKLQQFWKDMYMKLRYPRLYLRKRKLLIPVRFHELRHHFIEQNGLTPKFKVSQYLKRSLTSVLLDFVHISSAAWIMVMALGILLYYISGITLNATADKLTVYEFLVGALASGVVLFLIISVILYFKMRNIISKILVMKLTISDEMTGRQSTFRGFSALQSKMKSVDQINLFWGRNPRIIIVLTQFMQFGYALGLAAIFTYWTQFEGTGFKEKLLVILLIGYAIFLHFLADILPWFTVCTSLGQLVNKERLHETMAKMKLTEEVRKVEAANEAAAIEREISLRRRQVEEQLQAKKKREEEISSFKDFSSSHSGRKKSLSGGVGFMRMFQDRSSISTENTSSSSRRDKRKSLSDGVKLISDLNLNDNDAAEIFHSSSRLSDAAANELFIADESAVNRNPREFSSGQEEIKPKANTNIGFVDEQRPSVNGSSNMKLSRQERKHRRMKSKSEGVTSMRLSFDTAKFEALSELVNMPAEELPPVPEKPKRERSSRLKAISEGVSMMQLGPIPKDVPQSAASSDTNNSNGLALSRHDRKQRRRLMKCQSEGVAAMRLGPDATNMPSSHIGEVINRRPRRLEALSELANLPTKDLPEIPEKPKRKTRSRLRAISDGVSLMRANTSQSGENANLDSVLKNLNAASVEPKHSSNEPAPHKNVVGPHDDHEGNQARADTSVESINGESDIDDVPECDNVIIVRSKKWYENVVLSEILQGHRYHNLSLLFGPMVCCFWIAMRVEGFNMAEGVLVDNRNTFHFPLTTTFWLETAWFCMMLVERLLAFVVFARSKNGKEILSAIMGIVNVSTCLVLLLIAETKRCCIEYESHVRLLAAAVTADEYTSEYYASGDSSVTDCTCSAFGSRLYGGLGSIEPFTFLIALGPLRFLVAGPIARLLRMKSTVAHYEVEKDREHHHGTDPDAVRNIWLTTIGLHSEIAKQHGLFSVEILYCMLGLETPAPKSHNLNDDNVHEVYSPMPLESTQASEKTSEVNSHQDAGALKNSLGIVFDNDQFSYPDAKLIRRMRRCERKMLPLLDQWTLVDVVLTNHELVILEVSDEHDDLCNGSNSVLSDGGKGLRLTDVVKGRNVVSTFSLEEIDCIDIEHSISTGEAQTEDVESNSQELGEFWQGCKDALTYDPNDMSRRWCNVDEDRLKIHFTGGCGTLYLRLFVDLKEKEAGRSAAINIEENTSLLAFVGAETKIWCRTIARLCGVANLKMDLPHFGESAGDDELGDFVKITERETNGIKGHRRRLTRLPSQHW